MSERRISPEDSARLHDVRHTSYILTEKKRKAIADLPDGKILEQLDGFKGTSRVKLSRSTSQRVRLRLLLQEANKRGLRT